MSNSACPMDKASKTKSLVRLLCAIGIWLYLALAAHASDIIYMDGTETVEEEGAIYELAPDAAILVGFSDDANTIVIKSHIKGLPVSCPLDPRDAFGGKSARRLIVEEGVQSLGENTHRRLWGVEFMVVPGSLREVGSYTFRDMKSLREVVLHEGILRVARHTLDGCDKLETVWLPASVMQLEAECFDSRSLQSIHVAAGNKTYRSETGIVYSADGKTLVRYPSGRPGVFQVPEQVQLISADAFYFNYAMTGIVLPEGMQVLEEDVLLRCMRLQTISLPASMESIHPDALPRWTDLRAVYIAAENARYESIDGIPIDKQTGAMVMYPPCNREYLVMEGMFAAFEPAENEYISRIALPKDMKVLPQSFLSECSALETIASPMNLRTIGAGAFYRCVSLKSIVLPPFLRYIGAGAFYQCVSLTEIDIPQGTKWIEPSAFYGCSALASVQLPEGLVGIGRNAFEGCQSLSSLVVPDSVVVIEPQALKGLPPDFVVYAKEGSAAFDASIEMSVLWAEKPGDPPSYAAERVREHHEIAIIAPEHPSIPVAVLNVPDEEAIALAYLRAGDPVEVMHREGAYAYVRMGPYEGYLQQNMLAQAIETYDLWITRAYLDMYMKQDAIALYEYPHADAPVQMLPDDASVQITEPFGTWFCATWEGQAGYVRADSVRLTQDLDYDQDQRFYVVATETIGERLPLREGPSAQTRALGEYFTGTIVFGIHDDERDGERYEGYTEVTVDGKRGYMEDAYLQQVYTSYDLDYGDEYDALDVPRDMWFRVLSGEDG